MATLNEIQEYISNGSNHVEGYFYAPDMAHFYHIDQMQKQLGVDGDICELGVMHGKSLALMGMLSRNSEKLYAIDIFLDGRLEKTKETIKKYCPDLSNIEYIKENSTDITVDSLRESIKLPLRLLHIDAGHEYHEVLQSLYVFAPYVSNGGVIIMDDYHDREFPGIETAIHEFCRNYSPRRFTPFLIGSNKIYLCVDTISFQYKKYLSLHDFYKGNCRLTTVDNYSALIANSKLPMKNSVIQELLLNENIPREYNVNMDAITKLAKIHGQMTIMSKK